MNQMKTTIRQDQTDFQVYRKNGKKKHMREETFEAFPSSLRGSSDPCHDQTNLFTLVNSQFVQHVGMQDLFVLCTTYHMYIMFSTIKTTIKTARRQKYQLLIYIVFHVLPLLNRSV